MEVACAINPLEVSGLVLLTPCVLACVINPLEVASLLSCAINPLCSV